MMMFDFMRANNSLGESIFRLFFYDADLLRAILFVILKFVVVVFCIADDSELRLEFG